MSSWCALLYCLITSVSPQFIHSHLNVKQLQEEVGRGNIDWEDCTTWSWNKKTTKREQVTSNLQLLLSAHSLGTGIKFHPDQAHQKTYWKHSSAVWTTTRRVRCNPDFGQLPILMSSKQLKKKPEQPLLKPKQPSRKTPLLSQQRHLSIRFFTEKKKKVS